MRAVKLSSTLERWRELERGEGREIRHLAGTLAQARRENDWARVDAVAAALRAVALIKDPPEGEGT